MSTKQTRCSKLAILAFAGLVTAMLAGCVSTDMDDLALYIDEVKARKASRIEPLPEIKPYKSYTYSVSAQRDPFESFITMQTQAVKTAQPGSGLQPPVCGSGIRNCEELEEAPLDSLRMVGTLETSGRQWGILLASDGNIYRVRVGNYIGQNYGKIMSVSEDRIELREIIPDGLGGWQERSASLALSESE